MKVWQAWCPTLGETEDAALTVQATTPRKAAIRWAEESKRYARASAIDAGEVEVTIREVRYGDAQRFSLTVIQTVDYQAALIEGE